MEQTQENKPAQDNKLIPISIIIAGIFVAAAIYFGGSNNNSIAPSQNNSATTPALGEIAPVTASDNIVGSPDAKLVIVEYSDYECPFCKSFHTTMHQILSTYTNGEVAWVYRQFPIVQLHSKAPKESEAALCVNELGGNTAFWKFTDAIFLMTNSNDSLDPSQLPLLAASSGVDGNAFKTCLASGRYTKTVEDDVAAAAKAGAQGTPYSVIVTKSGQKIAINGAQPFEVVKSTIDSLLK